MLWCWYTGFLSFLSSDTMISQITVNRIFWSVRIIQELPGKKIPSQNSIQRLGIEFEFRKISNWNFDERVPWLKKWKQFKITKKCLRIRWNRWNLRLSPKFKVCTEASDWKNLEFCESLIERLKTMCGSWFGSSMRNLHSRVSLLSAVPSTRSPNSPTCWLCVAANLLTQPRVDWLTISIRRLKFLGKIVTN